MLNILRPRADAFVYAMAGTARAESAQRLSELYGGVAIEDPMLAWAHAARLAGSRGLVVVAGSIFLMASVRAGSWVSARIPPIAM